MLRACGVSEVGLAAAVVVLSSAVGGGKVRVAGHYERSLDSHHDHRQQDRPLD